MADSSSPQRFSAPSRGSKVKLLLILSASVAGGLLLGVSPDAVQRRALPIIQVILLAGGALQFGCSAILYWREGRKAVGLLWAFGCLGLALLLLPTMVRMLEVIGELW